MSLAIIEYRMVTGWVLKALLALGRGKHGICTRAQLEVAVLNILDKSRSLQWCFPTEVISIG